MRAWALLAVAALVACSSSGGSSGGTSSSSSGGTSGTSGNGGGGGGGGNSSCSCMITYNDVSGSANCGESACVNGEQFSCASDGSGATDQGACKTSQSDAGGGGGSSSGGSCTTVGGTSCEKDSDCCSGLLCYEEGCFAAPGGACTSDAQCQPDNGPFPGQSCTSAHTCCEKTNYACATQGPDPYCCSGTCGAPNSSGISFCL